LTLALSAVGNATYNAFCSVTGTDPLEKIKPYVERISQYSFTEGGVRKTWAARQYNPRIVESLKEKMANIEFSEDPYHSLNVLVRTPWGELALPDRAIKELSHPLQPHLDKDFVAFINKRGGGEHFLLNLLSFASGAQASDTGGKNDVKKTMEFVRTHIKNFPETEITHYIEQAALTLFQAIHAHATKTQDFSTLDRQKDAAVTAYEAVERALIGVQHFPGNFSYTLRDKIAESFAFAAEDYLTRYAAPTHDVPSTRWVDACFPQTEVEAALEQHAATKRVATR
ncbi:MAG: hypothetical protein EBR02_10450, partial [Alphaproteobacteria bacterium]|nr:hypothetical protein [Alphaproteobacteria bacterium]